MRLTVIISTYNKPDWLELTLWGYSVQTHRDFEIIIADDGSGDDTRERIDRLRAETGLPIRHVWHPDDGFRKSEILNRAIEAVTTDYLLFTDGDCIPRRDFLAAHVRFARPGTLLSGGYFKLPQAVSEAVAREDIFSGAAFTLPWLRAHGVRNCRCLKFALPEWLCAAANHLTTTRATCNGCNTSAWTADVLRVNGFDERMHYGGQDRELGERLVNAGIRPVQIRYHTTLLHLHHSRPYRNAPTLAFNEALRRTTRSTRTTWCDFGIVKRRRAPAAT